MHKAHREGERYAATYGHQAMLGGLLGTLGQILLVYGWPPAGGQALELAALRGLPCALGLLTHIVSGSVLLPLGYLPCRPTMCGPPRS